MSKGKSGTRVVREGPPEEVSSAETRRFKKSWEKWSRPWGEQKGACVVEGLG